MKRLKPKNSIISNENGKIEIDKNYKIIGNKNEKMLEDKSENITIDEDDNMNVENNEKNNITCEEKYLEINNLKERIRKEDMSTTEKCINVFKRIYPKMLEVYEIKEKIGNGSESIVYKIIYKKLNKQLAMKLIFIDNNSKRNINEYNISNRFKNKNIITFYGVYEIKKNELDCIIMEYGKFGNLKDFKQKIVKREKLPEQILCFLAYQILNGLSHLHKFKTIHFDLKPQNIVIDEYLNIKIIDFSVSMDYKGVKLNVIKLPFKGTNFYISPEVIKSKTININDLNKVDLYSLGVILYYLAFGTYPYDLNRNDSDDYDKIYSKIENNKLIFDNEGNYYSKFFIDFLSQLLEKDINKRININQALNNYWVNGAKILFEEKEKLYNGSSFLIYLLTDHFINYYNYIKN